jgi:hypothetical protein
MKKSYALRLSVVAFGVSLALVACGSGDEEGGDSGDGSAGEPSGGSAGKGGSGNSGTSGTGAMSTGGKGGTGGIPSDGGAGAGGEGATGGADTGGTAGSAGTGGSSGSPSNAGIDDAIAICVWTSGCLNTEDGAQGAAPNNSVSSCLETFSSEHQGNPRFPYSDYRDCIAEEPESCADFIACLEDSGALCPVAASDPQDWKKPNYCEDGTRQCASCNDDPCDGFSFTCTDDGKGYDTCFASVPEEIPCDPGWGGTCFSVGGAAVCLHGEEGTCNGTAPTTCDGTVATFCTDGVEISYDCGEFGQTCMEGMGCIHGTECNYLMMDSCDGDVLHACLSGYERDIDCTDFGGSCGTTRAGRDGCVFP